MVGGAGACRTVLVLYQAVAAKRIRRLATFHSPGTRARVGVHSSGQRCGGTTYFEAGTGRAARLVALRRRCCGRSRVRGGTVRTSSQGQERQTESGDLTFMYSDAWHRAKLFALRKGDTALANALGHLHFDVVCCSPLARARDTASI